MNSEVFERYKPIIDDWQAFSECLEKPLPVSVWTNTLKTTPGQLYARLEKKIPGIKKISWYDSAFRMPPETEKGKYIEYLSGQYQVQEEVAMLPVVFLEPQPGEKVLDLCAAPGNKTAQIAVTMKNKGTVVANDKDFNRIKAVRNAIERLGLLNVATTNIDGIRFPGNNLYDKVLADVPCTCEGTTRKKTGGNIKAVNVDKIKALAEFQKLLLKRAVELCKPGGRIVYSTCTYAPEENEMVVDWALKYFGPDTLKIIPADIKGFNYCKGLTEWEGNVFLPSLKDTMRVYPHQNDTGGFYIALLEKTGDASEPSLDKYFKFAYKIETADTDGFLPFINDRFAVNPGSWDDYTFFSSNSREVYVVNKGFTIDILPRTDALGLRFVRKNMIHPKPTNPAIITFGSILHKNVLNLYQEQARAFILRETFTPDDEQLKTVEHGYIILKYNEMTLGIGFYHNDKKTVESFYPKEPIIQEYIF